MPCCFDAAAQGVPVHGRRHVHFHVAAALFAQQVQRILRQDAAIPASPCSSSGARAPRPVRWRPVGVADGLHAERSAKVTASLEAYGTRISMRAILEAHDPRPTGRCFRLESCAFFTA